MNAVNTKRVFYTVTNTAYWPGTIATISSIRIFYPHDEIWIFAESRQLLTDEQERHLKTLNLVNYVRADQVPHGQIKEAWQLKAHAAYYLSTLYDCVLVQVDSDAILCSKICSIVDLSLLSGVPAGGKDGSGVDYSGPAYTAYRQLCKTQEDKVAGFNGKYVSSSVLVVPIQKCREILKLWSMAVDEASEFGPKNRPGSRYAGYSDQGIFNAILYFKGIEPIPIDNNLLSQHWVHGKQRVVFKDGAFWNGTQQQMAMHSVGFSPKFWKTEYTQYVADCNGHLDDTYLYWLFLLFDGPAGLFKLFSIAQIKECRLLLGCADLVEEYLGRRANRTKEVTDGFGRLGCSN